MVYVAASRLYTGDYDTGDFTQWAIVQNIAHNDPGEDYDGTHYALTLSTSTVRQGGYAARFEVRDGDIPFSTTERSEVQGELYTTGGEDGDERWYGFSVLFGDDFPDDHASTGWGLVNQWHDESAGSPPLGMYVDVADGEWGLRVNQQSAPGVFIDNPVLWSTTLDKGTWHDIVLRIVWSTSDTTGEIQLWHQGVRQTFTGGPDSGSTTTNIRTLVPTGGGTYYKEGYYREATLTDTGVVFHDAYAVASAADGIEWPQERHNLSAEPVPVSGSTGWVSNRSLSVAAVTGFDRDDAARITGAGSGGEHYIVPAPAAATAGTTYTGSASYRTSTGTQVNAYLLFLDASSSVLSSVAYSGNPISTTAGTVDRVHITGTAPANTTQVTVQVSLVSASTSQLDVTMALFEATDHDAAYFDGDTDSASWDGTTGLSTSTLAALSADPPPEEPATDPLGEAVDDHDRIVITKLEVDWDRDGTWDHTLTDLTPWVTGLSVERAATADLPVDATLVEGSVAATLTATLGGIQPDTGLELTGTDGLSALETFAPYRADSPLYQQALLGCGVRADIGLVTDEGVELIRQFTGQLRSLSPDSRSRTVTLAALDPADLLRAPITLPAHAQFIGDVLGSNHKLEIATQAVIDFVLRKNGIYASPPAHTEAQISCTGHGWLAAEAGRSAVPRGDAADIDDDWWYVDDPDHPFGMLAVRGVWDDNNLYAEFFAREREGYKPMTGYGIGMSVWAKVGNDMGVTAGTHEMFQLFPLVDHDALRLSFSLTSGGGLGGHVYVDGVSSGFVQSISTPTQWMYLGLHFQHMPDGQTRIRYRQNGVTTQGEVDTPLLTSPVAPFLQCTAWTTGRDWTNFQVWYDYDPPSGAWPGEVHTSQATLSPGLNRLTHLPDVVNADSWQVIRDAAAAEYGLAGFDEQGEFYFRSRDVAGDPTTVDKTVTADANLLDLATEINVDTVRNVVSTETTAAYLRVAVIAESRDVTEWQSPPGVWEHWVPLPWGAVAYTTITMPRVASASWTEDSWGYVSVRADSPSTEITSNILVAFSAGGDRLGVVKIWNYSTFTVRFATTSGSPAFRAIGWALQEEPPELAEVRAEGSISLYGARALSLDASPYRQLNAPLQPVAGGLLSTLSDPLPVIPNVPIVGDPRVFPGQVVRATDTHGQGTFRAYVVGTRQEVERGLLRTELALRPVVSPGFGLLDDDELGILDDTLILAP